MHVLRLGYRESDFAHRFRGVFCHSRQVARLRPRWKGNRPPGLIVNRLRWCAKKAFRLERTKPFRIVQAIEKIAIVFTVPELSHGLFNLLRSWRLPRFHRVPSSWRRM